MENTIKLESAQLDSCKLLEDGITRNGKLLTAAESSTSLYHL